MTTGSLQLQRYLSARRRGATMMTACAESAIPVSEARLIEADIRRDPSMLDPVPSPGGAAPVTPKLAGATAEPGREEAAPFQRSPEASNRTPSTQENDQMARGKKAQHGTVNGEVAKPDFELADRIYREDIKPAQSKVGEHSQEMSTAYKEIKKRAHIQPQAARLAFRLDTMEEAKRDDFLRSFNGLLKAMNIFMPADLVDVANGTAQHSENVVPIGDAPKPKLATIPQSDGVDADLAGDEPEGEEGDDADDLPHAAE